MQEYEEIVNKEELRQTAIKAKYKNRTNRYKTWVSNNNRACKRIRTIPVKKKPHQERDGYDVTRLNGRF
jgi:hypothetical protein